MVDTGRIVDDGIVAIKKEKKMGVKNYNDNNTKTKYKFIRKAGRSIIERCPVFSPDGQSLAVIVENIVRVYNIQTGECSHTLESEKGADNLVSIKFLDNDYYNLYGCAENGVLTIWTWEKGAILREIKLKIPKHMKVLCFDLVDEYECFIITHKLNDNDVQLSTYSVKDGELIFDYENTTPSYSTLLKASLGWCNGDRYAAISNGSKTLYIQNLSQPHLQAKIVNSKSFRITSVAAHPRENAVAITDSLGITTVLKGNLYDHRSVAREVKHWHFLPAMACCFSLQGNYLYTGGMEKVLVKWTVGNLATKAQEKAFIPRLPGLVRYITTNNTHIALSLSNNAVVIANAQMRVVTTILECGGLSPVARAVGTSLVYHRQSGGLLLGGRPGHLQLYSTNSDKVVYNLDITMANPIPPSRHNILPLETEITCAAVSADGKWLVTSEYRNDGVNYPEEKLKFWSSQSTNNYPFKLNTCVNLSHGGCNVVSLALDSKAEFCVSSGTDQKFRVWKKVPQKKSASWQCFSACYYSSDAASFASHGILNNFKNHNFSLDQDKKEVQPYLKKRAKDDVLEKIWDIHKNNNIFDKNVLYSGLELDVEDNMGGVALSEDGSLIAAWFGAKLTLWDTYESTLKTTLTHPELEPEGRHVTFGHSDASHFIICTTDSCLAVWSLLSLTVKWLIQMTPSCLIADPFSNRIAVVDTNNDLYVFNPHDKKPVLNKKCLIDPQDGVIKQCAFGTCTKNQIRLYVMRNDSEIYSLEPETSHTGRLEVMSRKNLPVSNFSALLAEQIQTDIVQAKPGDTDYIDIDKLQNSAISFLSAASHMIPPISLLSTSFLEHIIGKPDEEDIPEYENINDVHQESSDDEGPTLNGPLAPKTIKLLTANYEMVKEKRLKRIFKDDTYLDVVKLVF